MSVIVRPVEGRRDLRKFIELPFRLHAGSPYWVPPLRFERKQFLSAKRNPFFRRGEAQLFLAEREGQIVGRISAHLNPAFDETHPEDPRTGFFGFIEAEDDGAVFAALLHAASEWATSRGRARILGPMDFAMNDECGVLIDGFDREAMIHQPWQPPYYQQHIEAAGMGKAMDLFMYELEVGDRSSMLPILQQLADEAEPVHGVTVRKMTRRSLRRDIAIFAEIYNAAWQNNWDFVPYEDDAVAHMAREFQLVFHRDWFMIAEDKNGNPIGAAVSVPDINQVLRKMNGRLLPFGWVHFLRRHRIISRVRVGWLGVRPEFQHTGAGARLFIEHFDVAGRGAINWGELGWILENNTPMNRAMEAMGGRVVKRYRMYERPTASIASSAS